MGDLRDAAMQALVFLDAGPRLQKVLIFIIVLPLLLSVVVRTFAWIVVLGREGLVNTLLMKLDLISEPLRLLQTELGLVISLTQIDGTMNAGAAGAGGAAR